LSLSEEFHDYFGVTDNNNPLKQIESKE
jgi:hypothetical protein